MTYPEALAYISRIGRFGMKLGTERTRAILDRIGRPDRGLTGALIAGTNGKGSTGACLASILQAAGHVVGFMPKPHLVSYTERIQIDGIPITERDFAQTLEDLKPTLDVIAAEMGPATEFEMLTAMALAYLAPRVDRLVCEVGLGGRLDATNALDLGVAVITNVDLDHQKYLGDTIEEIAREKAAIIKAGNRVITGCEGAALAIVEDYARKAGAALWRLGEEIQVESTSRGWDGHLVTVADHDADRAHLVLDPLGAARVLLDQSDLIVTLEQVPGQVVTDLAAADHDDVRPGVIHPPSACGAAPLPAARAGLTPVVMYS